VALQLRKIGIHRVRPLLGGFYEWKKLGFPLVNVAQPVQVTVAHAQIATQSQT
jgi:3-mercaptopyruvate sulfurtransferase SseA